MDLVPPDRVWTGLPTGSDVLPLVDGRQIPRLAPDTSRRRWHHNLDQEKTNHQNTARRTPTPGLLFVPFFLNKYLHDSGIPFVFFKSRVVVLSKSYTCKVHVRSSSVLTTVKKGKTGSHTGCS